MYDLIGDIHGYADELVELLGTLGYQKAHGVYCHPERRVIFVGDFVDRGRSRGKPREDRSPGRVGKSAEGCAELIGRHVY